MLGGQQSSILETDAYKFSMAQVGSPMEPERFYLSFRKPGWHYIPFDLEAVIQALLPQAIRRSEILQLQAMGLGATEGMRLALAGFVVVEAAPKGSWIRENEPIVTIDGPSFLVSWLEPMCIWLNFPIQIATEALLNGQREFFCSCEDEAAIVSLVLEELDLADQAHIEVKKEEFQQAVFENATRLRDVLGGEKGLSRVFEVGMRGATCSQMHLLALESLQRAGIAQTSNVALAQRLGMQAVGSTGHEHQLRFGEDKRGFRAIRDRRNAPPSYLFDTYDAISLGIPAAIEVWREEPKIGASVRFDSGEIEQQLRLFVEAGVSPRFIFMDGMTAERVASLEATCTALKIPTQDRLYGVGGFLGCSALPHIWTRNRVSAVYKLSQSGKRSVMKFSKAGKQSLPGHLQILRKTSGEGPVSYIAQYGEFVGNNYIPITEYKPLARGRRPQGGAPMPSPQTKALMDACYARIFETPPTTKGN